jgi:hypothetical protein
MELAIVVFSAISAISTTTLAFLVLETQKNINTNAKKRTESDLNSYKQIESLLQRNQAIEQKLIELTDAQGKSIDKVYELLREGGDTEISKLKAIEQKLIELTDAQGKSIDKVYELLRESGDKQVGKLEELKNSLEESIRF